MLVRVEWETCFVHAAIETNRLSLSHALFQFHASAATALPGLSPSTSGAVVTSSPSEINAPSMHTQPLGTLVPRINIPSTSNLASPFNFGIPGTGPPKLNRLIAPISEEFDALGVTDAGRRPSELSPTEVEAWVDPAHRPPGAPIRMG